MAYLEHITVNDTNYDIHDPRIGDLENLETTDKSNMVEAVNEIKTQLDNSGQLIISDTFAPSTSLASTGVGFTPQVGKLYVVIITYVYDRPLALELHRDSDNLIVSAAYRSENGIQGQLNCMYFAMSDLSVTVFAQTATAGADHYNNIRIYQVN